MDIDKIDASWSLDTLLPDVTADEMRAPVACIGMMLMTLLDGLGMDGPLEVAKGLHAMSVGMPRPVLTKQFMQHLMHATDAKLAGLAETFATTETKGAKN